MQVKLCFQMLTACNRYPHLDRVFLTVINKGNSLVVLLNAIDGHTRLADHLIIGGGRLPDSDMIGSFPVPVMHLERLRTTHLQNSVDDYLDFCCKRG